MEQQQSQVTLSLATKLLASVLLLVIVIVGFLNFSGILLFQEDKRAYVYQSQSTEALLVGREFVNTATHVLDTLRLSLAQSTELNSVVNNQSDIVGISHHLVQVQTKIQNLVKTSTKEGELSSQRLTASDLVISGDWWKAILPELLEQSYGFVNLSKLGKPPLLAVFFADLSAAKKLSTEGGAVLVAVGYLPLEKFGNHLAGLNLSIAAKTGWLLFDTDSASQIQNASLSEDPLFKLASRSKLDGAQEFESNGERFIGTFVYPGSISSCS